MSDQKDYIEHFESVVHTARGDEITHEDIVNEFELVGFHARVQELMKLEADLEREDISLQRRAELFTLKRRMANSHERLTKAFR